MSNIEKIQDVISDLKNKDFSIYFFTIDTKGVANAATANMYEHVKMLGELGYNAHVLYDKEGYTSVKDWLGDDYADLSHKVIKDLEVSAKDVIVVPEVFSTVMKKLSEYPCRKVVFSQVYHHIFELLIPGESWDNNFKFHDVITTSDAQAEYISNHFQTVKTHVVPPSIPDYFKPSDKPTKPIINIMGRKSVDVVNLVNSFYLQYPMYKWVTFFDLRGYSREEFAEQIKGSCLSIWVDDISSFGTFPLESIESDVPVLGIIPNMIPEWMIEEGEDDSTKAIKNNGFWTDNVLNLPAMLYEYMNLWLTDSVPEIAFEEMEKTKGDYSVDKQKTKVEEVYGAIVSDMISDFNIILEKEKNKDDEK